MFARELRQRRAFAVPGFRLQNGEAVVQRLLENVIDTRTGQRAHAAGRGDELGAEDAGKGH
jgi:hypothetical protein